MQGLPRNVDSYSAEQDIPYIYGIQVHKRPTIRSYPESNASNPYPHILFLSYSYFSNIIFPFINLSFIGTFY